jgi:serine/threonine-protein kinase
MPLAPGTHLGPYEIVAPLGAGGMGEVYRASDSKLKREVAVKVLSSEFATDAQRMARFEREAQVLASLNHPNIASIYGLEESSGVRALVMELVEGPTLAERIAQSPIALEDAIPIAKQIAEALEYAHERAIIHRDLKPANIKVTPEGQVKVLDFGLAKALEGADSAEDISKSPTISMAATRAGVILGTAAYMSPEQAKGKSVDRRTDIWAFGVVLYELLTGAPVFTGETVSEVLAAVILKEPRWETLPAQIPPRIRQLLERCLRKDPKLRLRDIGDARILLEEILSGAEDSSVSGSVADERSVRSHSAYRMAAGALIVALLVAVLGLAWHEWRGRQTVSRPVVRFELAPPKDSTLADSQGPEILFSTAGDLLVFLAKSGDSSSLYTRRMDQTEARLIPGTEDAQFPFLSPDSKWIAFESANKLKKVSLEGGSPIDLTPSGWGGGCWLPDGSIIYTRAYNSGLWKLPPDGGTPVMLTEPDKSKGELSHWWPQLLPDGKTLLFTAMSTPVDRARIVVQSLQTGKRKTVIEGGVFARFVNSGHLLYVRGESILAVPFDVDRLEVTAPAVPVVEDVVYYPQNGAAQFTVSENGTLAYLKASAVQSESHLVVVDRTGNAKQIPSKLRQLFEVQLSPDGLRLAVSGRESQGTPDIWLYDLARGTWTRLTFGPASNRSPIWTSDGKRVLYLSERPVFDLYWKAADGSGSDELLVGNQEDKHPSSISPDGTTALFSISDPKNGLDLWLLSLTGKREIKPWRQTSFNEQAAVFSPDGRWVAYQSDETGRFEIYLEPVAGGARSQVSTDGGIEPMWARNGRELFYRNKRKLLSVPVQASGTTPSLGNPAVLFEGDFLFNYDYGSNYDVSPDGHRFYFVQTGKSSGDNVKINLVLNWTEELRRKVPTGKN